MGKIIIDTLYDKEDFFRRPKVSYKVREYIQKLFLENFLNEKNIIVNSKIDILLQMSFFINDEDDYISVLPPSVFKNENIKAYPIMIAYSKRIEEAKNVNIEFAIILFEAVSEFLLANFKKVTKDELENLKSKLDNDYISSIVYPAPFEEQRFVGDENINSKTVYLGR